MKGLVFLASAAAFASAQHDPLYHLESQLEATCFETTYTDAHFQENGFTLGSCDESFNTVLAKDNETVCNGHSEENVKYCPGSEITIQILKLGKATETDDDDVAAHKPVYHLTAQQESVCFETTYTDAHFQENGFKLGRCDETYNEILERREERICNGHSEQNTKYCPDDIITIEVDKMGKKATSDLKDFPPGSILYHVQAEQESVCFETNYTDAHYQENGFVLGRCDETYNTVINVTDTEICNGHSEMNVKYCPDSAINITVIKFGKQ